MLAITIWQAILLAIVEGITEFLPISSTGHMIIVSSLLGIENSDFVKLFEVNIQFGAILSVVVLYRKRFLQTIDVYYKLLAAFLPTAILGLILNDFVDELLESVQVVAVSLLIGGIVLLFVDRWFRNNKGHIENFSIRSVSLIGFFQALSMVPGISRSAATIVGGQVLGATRKSAAEFSFLLAVPTMAAASALKMLKGRELLFKADWTILLVGNVVAFIVAMLAIRFFIGFLTKYGFYYFGIYRILVGGFILILLGMGYNLSI